MDVPAELRRGDHRRRKDVESSGDLDDRSRADGEQAFRDSLRCERQEVGPLCGLGLGGEWCDVAAGETQSSDTFAKLAAEMRIPSTTLGVAYAFIFDSRRRR